MHPCKTDFPKKRKHFSKEEDEKLRKLVEKYGTFDWKIISQEMTNRSVRQCRERWENNLSNTIIKKKWTPEEERLLQVKVQEVGQKWKYLQQFFPGRTQYDIRNHWTCLLRKLQVQEITVPFVKHEKFVIPMINHDDSPCNSYQFEIDNSFEFDLGDHTGLLIEGFEPFNF